MGAARKRGTEEQRIKEGIAKRIQREAEALAAKALCSQQERQRLAAMSSADRAKRYQTQMGIAAILGLASSFSVPTRQGKSFSRGPK